MILNASARGPRVEALDPVVLAVVAVGRSDVTRAPSVAHRHSPRRAANSSGAPTAAIASKPSTAPSARHVIVAS